MRYALLAVLLVLAGCTNTLTAIPREGQGGPYKGLLIGEGSGDFTLTIEEKTYNGRWSWAGSGSFGMFSSYGIAAGASASPGIAIATSEDGSRLRCEFVYSEWTATGFGICKDQERSYDLLIE